MGDNIKYYDSRIKQWVISGTTNADEIEIKDPLELFESDRVEGALEEVGQKVITLESRLEEVIAGLEGATTYTHLVAEVDWNECENEEDLGLSCVQIVHNLDSFIVDVVCINSDTLYDEMVATKVIDKNTILLLIDEPINSGVLVSTSKTALNTYSEGGVDTERIEQIYNILAMNGLMPPDNPSMVYDSGIGSISGRKPVSIGSNLTFSHNVWLHEIEWPIQSSDSVKNVDVFLDKRNKRVFTGEMVGERGVFRIKLDTPLRLIGGIVYKFETCISVGDSALYSDSPTVLEPFLGSYSAYTIDFDGTENSAPNGGYGLCIKYSHCNLV